MLTNGVSPNKMLNLSVIYRKVAKHAIHKQNSMLHLSVYATAICSAST